MNFTEIKMILIIEDIEENITPLVDSLSDLASMPLVVQKTFRY
jgi:hypothetical protein